MSTVLEKMILEFGDRCHDSTLSPCGQSVKVQISLDHFCDMVTVSCCTSSSSVDIWSHVMKFETVLVSNDWTSSSSCICSESNSILICQRFTSYLVHTSYNSSSGRSLLDVCDSGFIPKDLVSMMIGKVETSLWNSA